MLEPQATSGAALVRDARSLWAEATRAPFLEALSAGTLPPEAFRRWLAQDYSFAKGLLVFQAVLIAKTPRDCHAPLISGLAALQNELEWFEAHAARLLLDLEVPPHPTCRRYTDFLVRCAYTDSYPVLLAILFGVEATYLAAWSALQPVGPFAEFVERWSSPGFGAYVAALRTLVDRYPHDSAQECFNQVLIYEREFWKMSWAG